MKLFNSLNDFFSFVELQEKAYRYLALLIWSPQDHKYNSPHEFTKYHLVIFRAPFRCPFFFPSFKCTSLVRYVALKIVNLIYILIKPILNSGLHGWCGNCIINVFDSLRIFHYSWPFKHPFVVCAPFV